MKVQVYVPINSVYLLLKDQKIERKIVLFLIYSLINFVIIVSLFHSKYSSPQVVSIQLSFKQIEALIK